jgi:hypothetical protein
MQRPMTAAERTALERLLADMSGSFRSEVVPSFLFLAAMMTAVAYLGWLLVVWLLRKAVDAAWTEGLDPWMLAVAAAGSAAYAGVIALRGFRRARTLIPALRRDLDAGVVEEEQFRFVEACRFQEPEHGGLIYVLRGADERTLVLYDAESQELGAADKDPLRSRFRARSELAIVKAPQAGITLDKRFSGAHLDAGPPAPLTLAPAKWPEDESHCPVPWSQLKQYLAGA